VVDGHQTGDNVGNEFDSSNYPSTEPTKLIAGDRWAWKRTDLGGYYPPADYALTYSARLEGSGATEISITASESVSDYIVEVASATTEAYTAGKYHWQAYITRSSDSERITVDSGTFEVIADRDNATTDPRTHVKIVLDAIQAVIESRASKDQEAYSINGRSLNRTPLKDLIMLRDKYAALYASEQKAERIANGLGSNSRVLVRF
jgi:hypothetical protein